MQRSEEEDGKRVHESFVMSRWQWWAWRMTMFPSDYFHFFPQLVLASLLLLQLLLSPPPPPLPPTSPQLPCCGSRKRLLGEGQSQQSLPPFSQPPNTMSTVHYERVRQWPTRKYGWNIKTFTLSFFSCISIFLLSLQQALIYYCIQVTLERQEPTVMLFLNIQDDIRFSSLIPWCKKWQPTLLTLITLYKTGNVTPSNLQKSYCAFTCLVFSTDNLNLSNLSNI